MAMLIVLWFIVTGSVMVASFGATARSGAHLMTSELQISKANAALDGALEIAAAHLIDANDKARWKPQPQPRALTIGDFKVAITIADPNGLIDINKAKAETLKRFLMRFAGSEQRAAELSTAIMNAREGRPGSGEDELAKRNNQREDDGYQTDSDAPLSPFIDISQLRQIEGITPSLYKAITPYITVYSRNGSINPLTAPNQVLAAIPDLNADAIERLRRSNTSSDDRMRGLSNAAQSSLSDDVGPAYAITIVATKSKFQSARTYVIATGLDPDSPYRLLSKKTADMPVTFGAEAAP